MLLAVEIIGIIFMITVAGISIVTFILLNKIFAQLKYKNYIMEKLTQNIYMLSSKKDIEFCAKKLLSEEEVKAE